MRLYLVLMALGCGWGLTMPLTRIAVSTGHPPLGLLVWSQVFMLAILVPLMLATGRGLPPLRRFGGVFLTVALLGSVLPGYFSYLTAVDLPAGVRSIIIAIVPMFALPIAVLAGFERLEAVRLAGVLMGAVAIVLIAQPGAGLPPEVTAGLILLALIAPLSYGVEANYLAWRGSLGLHPFQLMVGASSAGVLMALPLAVASGQTVDLVVVWGPAEWAMVVGSFLNALAYSGFVWLVAQAGSVFASQCSYLVTGFGVVWSKLILSESYSGWVWAAFALMLAGVALVQPRAAAAKNP
jgi:drug/metabolite transporter (DMT)-like permease